MFVYRIKWEEHFCDYLCLFRSCSNDILSSKGKVGTNDLPPVDFTSYEAAVAWVERRLLSFPEDCITQPDKSNQQNTELNQISICHHWLHLLSFVRRCISPPVRRAGRLSLFRLSLSAVYHVTLPADSLKKCFKFNEKPASCRCWSIFSCGRQDLNLHGLPPGPKPGASANSATPALPKPSYLSLRVSPPGQPQYRHR